MLLMKWHTTQATAGMLKSMDHMVGLNALVSPIAVVTTSKPMRKPLENHFVLVANFWNRKLSTSMAGPSMAGLRVQRSVQMPVK